MSLIEDRLDVTEDQKSVVSSMFGAPGKSRSKSQHRGPISEGDDGNESEHPDREFAQNLFRESAGGKPQIRSNPAGLDLGPLEKAESKQRRGRTVIKEDLVQQAAQALVKSQIDGFLAITSRMSPDEVLQSLQTARQWRRPEDNWQDDFKAAPESGFKFIDRAKDKNEAAAARVSQFVEQVLAKIDQDNLPPTSVPRVVREMLKAAGVTLPLKLQTKLESLVIRQLQV